MRLILTMGLFSFFTSCENKVKDAKTIVPEQPITIDIGTFRVGDSLLGEIPAATDSFATPLQKADVFKESAQGIEIGTRDNLLDYLFLTTSKFTGQLLANGVPFKIGKTTTEATIKARFGEPYWIDRSDGETILFYVYSNGTIELQFEFPSAQTLAFITLARNGTLSKEEQRKMYGVTKPWPPK